ncbi:MAG: glutathione S-transferase [Gammaproteobacteria bacterium]
MEGPYTIYGALGSPYSMKMRAVLRYRRLPHIFVAAMPGDPPIADVRPAVIPVLLFPDGSWHVDSTPIVETLERQLPPMRSLVPEDPALAFLAWLIEDFADEWGTKLMFHYRWYRQPDQEAFSHWGTFDRLPGSGREVIERTARAFAERQISRMPLVGCTEQNRELIEATFHELIGLLDAHVTERHFVFGSRPSVADFGLYGQLSQLAVDPTPAGIMRDQTPYAWRWVGHVDDASGIEGEWLDGEHADCALLDGLLALCNEVYLPFLAANAAAISAASDSFELELRGRRYAQGSFRYQAKCLARLRERYAALDPASRTRVDEALGAGEGVAILAAADI